MKSFIYSISIIIKMQSDILKITDIPLVDETIERYEFHEYEPTARTNLNTAGEIRIHRKLQDLFSHPSESYLQFEGRLTKTDNTAYVNADVVALTNNGLMHLFSQISYSLSNQEIETLFHPGQATTMLGLLKYPNDFQLAQGLNQLWYKDSTDNTAYVNADAVALTNNGLMHLFSQISYSLSNQEIETFQDKLTVAFYKYRILYLIKKLKRYFTRVKQQRCLDCLNTQTIFSWRKVSISCGIRTVQRPQL